MDAENVRYQFDTVEVQPAAFLVQRDGRPVDLEPKAVRTLLYLIEHRNRAVSKEELIETVWEGTPVTDNAITRVVAQIRRELGDDARQARYIQTLPTTGYRFIADVRAVPTKEAPGPVADTRRRPVWILLLVAAAALALSGWILHRGWVLPGGGLSSLQLTTSPGLDISASFSPDGKRFAYCSNRSGRFEIYTRPVASPGGEIQITNDGKQNIDAAWSPDGRWIAYHSVAQHGIWLVPAGGGTPKRLTAFGSTPAWSPAGKMIAFQSTEPVSLASFDAGGATRSAIWTVTADGSRLRQVTWNNPRGQHIAPSWSFDGRRVVFAVQGPDSSIWSVGLTNGDLKALVNAGQDIPRRPGESITQLGNPKYSPVGDGLYFSGVTGRGDYAIYLQANAGERAVELYSTQHEVPSAFALSRDGKRVVFTRLSNISQLWTVAPRAQPKPLFQETVLRAYLPRFSPDGSRLAFSVQTAGRNRDLWLMNADGSGAAPVSGDPGPKEGANYWNAKGTGLLYNYADAARLEFRRYDPERKTDEVLYSWPPLRDIRPPLQMPVLMPDEREVLCVCSSPPNICLGPAKRGSGPYRQITFHREGANFPSRSSDGQWIVHNVYRGDTVQIGITDSSGRRQEVLTDDPGLNWAHSFSADSRRIAFAAYRDGVWNIWWIDRVTRERQQVTHHTAYGSFVRYPAWRPGTEEIVYEYSQAKGNVYLLTLP